MARIIGTPGESAAAGGLLRVGVVIGTYIFVLIPAVIWAVRDASTKAGVTGFIGITIALAAILWWQRDGFADAVELLRDGSHWLKGAYGERLVSQALATLPDEYVVFNDFHPLDSSTGRPAKWNVDHIVVGPNGVYVIDAKYYANPFVPCAAKNRFTKRNVSQAKRNALELKDRLARWSGGALSGLFVVPVVVYAQPDARTECLREGVVRTMPLRLLAQEVSSNTDGALDQEKAGRIARVLFTQIGTDLQYSFKAEFDAYGELSKAARLAARDERLARAASPSQEQLSPEPIPASCPRCGGALVRRVAKHGERTGKPFLGCQNYPKTGCRYGYNLDE